MPERVIKPRNADLIVLAGDIHVSPLGAQNFIASLPAATPKLVVLGNHEYDAWDEPALGSAEPLYRAELATVANSHLLERQRFDLEDVTVLGATAQSRAILLESASGCNTFAQVVRARSNGEFPRAVLGAPIS